MTEKIKHVYFKIEGKEKEHIDFSIVLAMGVITEWVDNADGDVLLIRPGKPENQAEALKNLRESGFKCEHNKKHSFVEGRRIIYTVTVPDMNPPWYDSRKRR